MSLDRTTIKEVCNDARDFLKQIITLSTGAVVLMASFGEKIISKAQSRITLKISLISFVLSILVSFLAIYAVLTVMYLGLPGNENPDRWAKSVKPLFVIAVMLMALGISLLAYFVCVNY